MSKAEFGMIGLGVMGRNFLLNVAENGFSCVGYDLDQAKRELLLAEGKDYDVSAAANIDEFLSNLQSPRRIMVLVPAHVVDVVLNDLSARVDKGDLLIDGGNSHFPDTERRESFLNEKGIQFIGVGVSGGEEGARHGCAIMPGGNPEIYELVRPVFEAVSAKVDGEPCVTYIGKGSAGQFVKMVHNGIEYGLMQLISETYDMMNRGLGMSYPDMAKVFDTWNKAELSSFLIGITSTVLRKTDDKTGRPLVEMILDTAGQKGTGKWTSQAAMDFGVPIPTIDSAVSMRQLSSLKHARVDFSKQITHPASAVELEIDTLRDALYAAFIITYAQGLNLLTVASAEKQYGLDLAAISKIWRGGCIIRASLLEKFRVSYSSRPELSNILFDPDFAALLNVKIRSLRKVVRVSAESGISSYCLMSSLAYFDALSSERLPANLLQAQRDFFGAHTYQRLDIEGTFHTPDWDH